MNKNFSKETITAQNSANQGIINIITNLFFKEDEVQVGKYLLTSSEEEGDWGIVVLNQEDEDEMEYYCYSEDGQQRHTVEELAELIVADFPGIQA